MLHLSVNGGPWRDAPLNLIPSSRGRWAEAVIPLDGAVCLALCFPAFLEPFPSTKSPPCDHVPQARVDGKPLLEFVATDGSSWDNNQGTNYRIDAPGCGAQQTPARSMTASSDTPFAPVPPCSEYILRHGALEQNTKPPFLVVSDLDGTLVGDDNALEAFREYWENFAVRRGCRRALPSPLPAAGRSSAGSA